MRFVALAVLLAGAVAHAEPTLPTCAEATAELAGGDEIVPLPDRPKLPAPSAAERRAIANAAKRYVGGLYANTEQQRVRRALDRMIASGARFEVHQLAALPRAAVDAERVALISFSLDDVPEIDIGPYLVLLVRRAGQWHAAMNVWFDPDARITGVVKKSLVFEHVNGNRRDVWLVGVEQPRPARPDALLASRTCVAR